MIYLLMTNGEILDRFKKHRGIETDYALAVYLGTSRQAVHNFRNRQTDSILSRIAADLLQPKKGKTRNQ